MQPYRISETANAGLQNRINISIVFNYVREHGPSYRADMSRALKLSAPAVSRAVEQLLREGYLAESGTAVARGGRTAAEVSVNPGKGVVVGVDLLKGDPKFGVFDFAGRPRLVLRTKRPIASTRLPRRFPELLVESIQAALVRAVAEDPDGDPVSPAAVCVGIPAAVDPDTGTVSGVPLFPELAQIDIGKIVRDRFGVPCLVENDVKLAAFAENRLGSGRSYRDLLYIDVNDGVGAGIIVGNQLLRGSGGFAGEIGYSRVAPASGSSLPRATLEEVGSLAALCRGAERTLGSGVETAMSGVAAERPEAVFAAALEGDHPACSLIERAVGTMADTIASTILVLDPQVVVIGGDVLTMPGVDQLYLEPLRRRIEDSLPFPAPAIERSGLGSDGCVYGASLIAVETLLLKRYPFAVGGGSRGFDS